MKPSIGRIVHFYPVESDSESTQNQVEFVPAVITNVWSDTLVNLKVLPDGDGSPFRPSIDQKQAVPEGFKPYWDWPPRV